jgi:DNA invertase Pin-like site-specific DNA recombinase
MSGRRYVMLQLTAADMRVLDQLREKYRLKSQRGAIAQATRDAVWRELAPECALGMLPLVADRRRGSNMTRDQRIEVRRQLAHGTPPKTIAFDLGVSLSSVYRIKGPVRRSA